MRQKVQDLMNVLTEDTLAVAIRAQYQTYRTQRIVWEKEKRELRSYLFATDTSSTTNSTLPWKNKTTLPKLTQIRDNLHANYLAALFPSDRWFTWAPGDVQGTKKEKRVAIEAYLQQKLIQSGFYQTCSMLLLDYIDYGNAIADVEYVVEQHLGPDGAPVIDYVGPRLVRHSPVDVVFNLDAVDFKHTPKITRSLKTIGELIKDVKTRPALGYDEAVIKEILEERGKLNDYSPRDFDKAFDYRVAGFGDLKEYYGSQTVEIIEFEGDIYDIETGELQENRLITVVDQRRILRNVALDTWSGFSTKAHVGWRKRQDNLMAMGPLDNLVGMQYRIDHLENLKADIFDLVVHPILKIKGTVEDFTWSPGERIIEGEDGNVSQLAVDTGVLQADAQIGMLMNQMEEMAGAPRQALGFRTPGEKTAFEVQSLQNAATRIFQIKITQFEVEFLEPLLNAMLEVARENLDTVDLIKTIDSTSGATNFLKITKDDIKQRGRVKPTGAQHFNTRNNIVQTLTQLSQSPLFADPSVRSHFSSKRIATLFEELLNLERFELVSENVAIAEGFEQAQLQQAAAQQLQPQQPPQGAVEEAANGEV